jgi:sn-glycerol 3-phosphate transport system permease protein
MKRMRFCDHIVLLFGVVMMMGPLVLAFTTSTFDHVLIHKEGMQLGWGGRFSRTYVTVPTRQGGFTGEVTGWLMTRNSFIPGIGFAVGKIVVSMLAAYAIVHFRFPPATLSFWIIFLTLLPLEVRILPSYEVVQELGLLNSCTGLILPLIASATGTFFSRQFFKSVPNELLEAARIDGAGPFRFFRDILVPLSRTMLAMLPPALVIIILQRMFITGLVEQKNDDAADQERGQALCERGRGGGGRDRDRRAAPGPSDLASRAGDLRHPARAGASRPRRRRRGGGDRDRCRRGRGVGRAPAGAWPHRRRRDHRDPARRRAHARPAHAARRARRRYASLRFRHRRSPLTTGAGRCPVVPRWPRPDAAPRWRRAPKPLEEMAGFVPVSRFPAVQRARVAALLPRFGRALAPG